MAQTKRPHEILTFDESPRSRRPTSTCGEVDGALERPGNQEPQADREAPRNRGAGPSTGFESRYDRCLQLSAHGSHHCPAPVPNGTHGSAPERRQRKHRREKGTEPEPRPFFRAGHRNRWPPYPEVLLIHADLRARRSSPCCRRRWSPLRWCRCATRGRRRSFRSYQVRSPRTGTRSASWSHLRGR